MKGLKYGVMGAGLLGLLLLLPNCTYVPFDAPRTETTALPPGGSVARMADTLTAGQSTGVTAAPLTDGNDALGARLRLIERAERSIDLQTFLIKPDTAGALIWLALYEAAERGVRVRLLYDDVFTTARDDQIATLDAHPNVEIRSFNPLSRNSIYAMNFVLDFRRVNRRMHNKSLIIDNAIAIIGGRNVADEYYQIGTDSEFADFDMLVAGAPVAKLSRGFDLYWNDKWSVPLAALEQGDPEALGIALEEFRAAEDSEAAEVYARAVNAPYLDDLLKGAEPMFRGRADFYVDDPDKLRNRPYTGPFVLEEAYYDALSRAESSLIVLTPYFVPEKTGAAFFSQMAQRGVKVRIVTNSLASTNHPYVHGHYSRYRQQLLAAGVEIIEVRVDAPFLTGRLDAPLTLHTKLAVIDDDAVFVGSNNIDPRSFRQNTELGMLIESPTLARYILNRLNSAASDYAFDVQRQPQNDNLWLYTGAGRDEVFKREPLASFFRKIVATVSGWLPIESQL
ncbi:phosphatidylserine/phosphatidylglycerophosphate/cardiolipin synthase family protein [Pseudooceanicola sp. LIPI14-2-Ac024]|uniref:phospholipase D-like domain-containing protein n=1 Tax=Pseudooceanicola sp. LIPI14-2-Ac024 TaxID=3344875 RepID=UPI0035D0AA74